MRARRRAGRGIVFAIGVAMLGLAGTACGEGASADADNKGFVAVPDRVTRLVIDVDSSFDEFKSRYEQAVPAFSPDKIAGLADWNAVVADGGARAAWLSSLRQGRRRTGHEAQRASPEGRQLPDG